MMKRDILFVFFVLMAGFVSARVSSCPVGTVSDGSEQEWVLETDWTAGCPIVIIDDTTYDFYRHEYLRHRRNAFLFAGIGLPVSAGLYASAWYTMMGVFSISGIAGAALTTAGIVVEAVKSGRYRQKMEALEPAMDTASYRLRN